MQLLFECCALWHWQMNVMSLGIIGALFYAGMLDGLLAHRGKREYFLQTRYKLLEIIRAPGKSFKDPCQPGKWHQLDER